MSTQIYDSHYWIIFGVRANGYVDIADANKDVLTNIHPELAEKIIEAHNASIEEADKLLSEASRV